MINLYGHTHQQTNFYNNNPFMYHVGVDSHNCYPISIEQISEDIHNKINELYQLKVQKEKNSLKAFEEFAEAYNSAIKYFDSHPIGPEILDSI